jgi:hypothetical protein
MLDARMMNELTIMKTIIFVDYQWLSYLCKSMRSNGKRR